MSEQAKEAIAADVAEMMTRYSFDLGGYLLTQWLDQWLQHYPAVWLPSAVIEALYQGRYKAISVWQILDLWRRRGKPLQHFNREFERMVLGRSLQLLFSPSAASQSVITVAEPALVTAEANGRQFWTQNGNLSDTNWRRQTYSTVLTPLAASSLVVPSSQSISSSQAAPEANRSAESVTPRPVIEPFKPSEQFKLSLPGEIHRTRAVAAKYPIQQFVPTQESSEFYGKLKAIVQALSIANAQAVTNTLAAARPIEPHSDQLTNPAFNSAEVSKQPDLDELAE